MPTTLNKKLERSGLMAADDKYITELAKRMRELADDCFDRRVSSQLHELANKIEGEMGRPKDDPSKKPAA